MPLPAFPVLPFRGAAPCGVDLRPEFAVMVGQSPYLVDLWNGENMELVAGAPTVTTLPYVGNAMPIVTSPGTYLRWSRSRRTTMTNTDITVGVILQFNTVSTFRIFSTDTVNGFALQVLVPSNQVSFTKNTVADIPNLGSISANIPYFIGVTYRAVDGLCKSVVRRLDTGAYTTASASNTNTPADGSGYVVIGGSGAPDASLAMAVLAYQYLGPEQLLAWAMDPWAPFYPDEFRLPGSASFNPVWASGCNIFMGVLR